MFKRLINRFVKFNCNINGHDWRYNFMSLPNKAICYKCDKKMGLNLRTLEWEDVDSFNSNLGTDQEIKNRWSK